MSGIVLELQRNVLDPSIDVITLLRQAYLISKKLELSEFERWVNKELNGYESSDKIPDYRILRGELKALNPYRGWIPIMVDNLQVQMELSKHHTRNSIPSLVSLLKAEKGVQVNIPIHFFANLGLRIDLGLPEYALKLQENAVEAIMETVRNKLLDWSLLLEENGIIGEDLRFSDEEKKCADKPQIINYTNNFFADASNLQMQQGTSHSQQHNGKQNRS
ncbi:MAG: hypothetical protein FWG63_08865 [Defluviitaleaceae bacterium]|nr:hypothetical protein [Defluviitaleaceae bacterium]